MIKEIVYALFVYLKFSTLLKFRNYLNLFPMALFFLETILKSLHKATPQCLFNF